MVHSSKSRSDEARFLIVGSSRSFPFVLNSRPTLCAGRVFLFYALVANFHVKGGEFNGRSKFT